MVAIAVSAILGICIALLMLSSSKSIRFATSFYVEIMRGTPALLQLFIVYFGLTTYGIRIDAAIAAWLAIGLQGAAYAGDIFRSGISSVSRGQIEAARSLGLSSFLTFRKIIMPQALKVSLPPFTSFSVGLIKDSSLALTIAVPEIMYRSYDIASQTFMSMEVYTVSAILYLSICFPLSRIALWLEKGRRR
jgi:polar amino acid transport system permease protein